MKKLWYVCVFLALAGILAACAPASQKPPAPAEEAKLKPQYGGTFIMRAGPPESPSFDQRQTIGGGQMGHISALVYSGLIRFPFTSVATAAPLECDLCERWEQPNDTTYVFYLRKRVKWHNKPPLNGREMTAEDIRWALTDGEGYDSKNGQFSGAFRDLTRKFGAKVEAVDKYTVKITLKEPNATFLMSLATATFTYPPKEAVEASKNDKNPSGFIGVGLTDVRYAIGTGPFMLKEYTPQVGGTLVRNPDYFRKDENGNPLPYLDEVKVLYIPDHKVRTNAMLGGRVDDGGVYFDDTDLAKLERTGNFNFDVGFGGGFVSILHFNAEKPPFNDVRVRRAVHLIVDRFEVMVSINNRSAQVLRWVPSAFQPYGTPYEAVMKLPGYRPDKTQDFEEAKRLLKAASLEGGFSTTFIAATGGKDVEHATVIQAELKPFKIDVKMNVMDRVTRLQRQLDGAYEAIMYPTSPSADPSGQLWTHHTINAKDNHRLVDPRLDALIEKQDRIFDPKERAKVMAQLYDLLDETMPMLTMYHAPWYRAWPKWFHNVKAEPQTQGLFRWTELIWREKPT